MPDKLALRTEVTEDGNLEGEIILDKEEFNESIDELKSEADYLGPTLYISPVVFDQDLGSYVSNGDYEPFYKGDC